MNLIAIDLMNWENVTYEGCQTAIELLQKYPHRKGFHYVAQIMSLCGYPLNERGTAGILGFLYENPEWIGHILVHFRNMNPDETQRYVEEVERLRREETFYSFIPESTRPVIGVVYGLLRLVGNVFSEENVRNFRRSLKEIIGDRGI